MAKWIIPERKEDPNIKNMLQYLNLLTRDVDEIKDCRFDNQKNQIAISMKAKIDRMKDILKNGS
jgi:hypothetical protein